VRPLPLRTVNRNFAATIDRVPLKGEIRFLQDAAGCTVFGRSQPDKGWQLESWQPDARQLVRDLARKSLAPKTAFERVGNLDLIYAIHDDAPESCPPGELAISRSQRPKSEAMSIPMGRVDGEINLRCLGRAHAAEIAGHLRIEVQRDQVLKVSFVQPLGPAAAVVYVFPS
jgi:hypothetical protein